MESNNPKPNAPDKGLVALIGNALVDPDVRKELLANPDSLARQYELHPADADALKSIDASKFDQAANQLGGRAEWVFGIGYHGTFDAKD